MTCAVAVAVLFAATGSVVEESTVAEAVSETKSFFTVGTTVSVIVAAVPLASEPSEQIIVPVAPTGGLEHEPWLVVALTNCV